MDTISHVRAFFERYPDADNEKNRMIVLEVNRLMDVMGPGPVGQLHHWRKFLHHTEGIDYFTYTYGVVGGQAAYEHIMDDCGSVHSVSDYYNGTLDENGVAK